MSGITSGVGIFSGINSSQLIEQLLAVQSRPRILAQRRLAQLQTQQAAYLDINSRLNALKTAASAFRTGLTFQSRGATSSDEDVLTATASPGAQAGSYQFLVDRLVSTQQYLSKGFSDRDVSGLGLSSVTLESAKARVDKDTALSELNDGAGIKRGKLKIDGVEIDLSRVGTVGEVLDAINSADGLSVVARVEDGRFVLDGATTVQEVANGTTAASLGIDSASTSVSGTDLVGARVFGLNRSTALAALNDGLGVSIRATTGEGVSDFTIQIGADTAVGVRIGNIEKLVDDKLTVVSPAVGTLGGVVDRINTALADAGYTNVTASLNKASGRIEINDAGGRTITIANSSSVVDTAGELGIAGSFGGGTVQGRRVLAGMNTVLMTSVNGGNGLGETDGLLDFTASDGSTFSVDVSTATTLDEAIRLINDAPANAGKVIASINELGTGLQVRDTAGGASPLVVSGTDGADAATALGIAGTFDDGLSTGGGLQMAYIGAATQLSSLRDGQGIGTGKFEIFDATGARAVIDVTENTKTVGQLMRLINDAGINVQARINDTGDGLVIEEKIPDGGSAGGVKIRIADVGGGVAKNLRIAGTAEATGESNKIDGSYETVVDFELTDTLDEVAAKINEAGVGVSVAVINDGTGSTPFRLSITSTRSGEVGRFVFDTGDFDLGLDVLDEGNNAKVFFGSSDPSRGVLLTSTTNTVDGVVRGAAISLKSPSDTPVTLSISTDVDAIEESVDAFVSAFNSVLTSIDDKTRYVQDTDSRGPLLGDGTAITLRQALIGRARGSNTGFSEQFNDLSAVGITVGEGGKLSFDKDRFREALETDPEAVERLFTRRDIDPDSGTTDLGDGVSVSNPNAATEFSALGVIAQIEEFANDYVTSLGGILTEKKTSLDRQIKLQQDRIDSLAAGLESKRTVLQRQFLAMEEAIGRLQTQQGSLGNIQLLG